MGEFSKSFLKFAWVYALRNTRRNLRRTLITTFAVGLAVLVTFFALRYSEAVLTIWEQGSIDYGNGHAQLTLPGLNESTELLSRSTTFVDGHPGEGLSNKAAVLAASKRLHFEGVISSGAKIIYFLGRGFLPDQEKRVAPKELASHHQLPKGENGVLIGNEMAKTLDLRVGDTASLTLQTFEGPVNVIDVTINGIIHPPLPALSKRLLFMNLDDAQIALNAKGRYSQMVFRLTNQEELSRWIESHRDLANKHGAELVPWWEIDPVVRRVAGIWNAVVGIIILLLALSSGISVLNMIYMIVGERVVEIGTLMAIGARSWDIKRLFALEGAILGLLGGFSGAGVGTVALAVLARVGVAFDSPFGEGKVLVFPTFDGFTCGLVVLMGVLICLSASIIPAMRASQVAPVTAFRGQLT
jgi:putative ABC transport system permease protein